MQNNILAQTFEHQRRWINWKYEKDDDGRDTKVPYQINGTDRASTTNPATWSTYQQVSENSQNIGIVFTPDELLLGIDIDHCLEDGAIVHKQKESIEKFIKEANTYFEISPSGTGLHGFLKLTSPLSLKRNKEAPFELYTHGRYFTVTNKSFGEPCEVRTVSPEEAEDLLAITGYPWKQEESTKIKKLIPSLILDDETVLYKMFSSKNGTKIKALYDGDITSHNNDDSSADMALCSHLAFWTGKNSDQIERIWLNSPLGLRNKTQERKDYRDRTILKAIQDCNEVYSESMKISLEMDKNFFKEKSLTEDFLNQDGIILFHDENKEAYIALNINDHREVWPCKHKTIRILLAKLSWEKYGKAIGSESIKNIINILEGKARFDGEMIKLHNRIAHYEGNLWYDLGNENWEFLKITPDGWSIEKNPPIIFRRYPHHLSQLNPSQYNNLECLLDHINIINPEHKLLLLVYIVSCFIPGFPHVMLTVFGSQGSSKSTLLRLLRMTIDPSMVDIASFPSSQKELIQMLAHNHFLPFDNVSYISEDNSDTLCKAITGGGHVKRELFENDEDIIYKFMRCISINGINLVTTRPDLLERSLLIELERIEPEKRMTENKLYEKFNKDLPDILCGVFNALAKAQKIYPTIQLKSHPRMADWAHWGCAIAEALGYKQADFLKAYYNNINRQTEMLVNENIVAIALMQFMENKKEHIATPTDLLQQLTNDASFNDIDTREKGWPKGAHILSRRLNELSTPLKEMGLNVQMTTKDAKKIVHIWRTKNEEEKRKELRANCSIDAIISGSNGKNNEVRDFFEPY